MGNVMTALRVVTRKGINSEVDFSKKDWRLRNTSCACILHTLPIVVWRFLQMGNEDQLDKLTSTFLLATSVWRGFCYTLLIDFSFVQLGALRYLTTLKRPSDHPFE